MQNPYVAASIRKMQRDRSLRLPAAQPEWVTTERQTAFLDAAAIPHGGNRARVLTAIVHQLSDRELQELVARMRAEAEAMAAKLEGLGAPAVIVENARRPSAALVLAVRALARREL